MPSIETLIAAVGVVVATVLLAMLPIAVGLEDHTLEFFAMLAAIVVLILGPRRVRQDEVIVALMTYPDEYLDAQQVARIIRAKNVPRRKVSVSSASFRLDDLKREGVVEFIRKSTSDGDAYTYRLRQTAPEYGVDRTATGYIPSHRSA